MDKVSKQQPSAALPNTQRKAPLAQTISKSASSTSTSPTLSSPNSWSSLYGYWSRSNIFQTTYEPQADGERSNYWYSSILPVAGILLHAFVIDYLLPSSTEEHNHKQLQPPSNTDTFAQVAAHNFAHPYKAPHRTSGHVTEALLLPLHPQSVRSYPPIIDAATLFPKPRHSNKVNIHSKPMKHSETSNSSNGTPENGTYRLLERAGLLVQSKENFGTLRLPYPKMSFAEELKAVLIWFGIVGSFFYIPAILFYTYRKFCTTRRRKLIFWIAVLITVVAPIQGSSRFRQWSGWKLLHKYLQISAIVEEPHRFPPSHPTLYAIMPHGIIPLANGTVCTLGFNDFLQSTKIAIASIVPHIPLYGHLCKLFGYVAADRSHLHNALVDNNDNIVISPGGIAEIYNSDERKESLSIKNRFGFVRLALETGANIVPIYCFGNTHCFKLLPGSYLLRSVARKLRIALILFFGRMGLPIPLKVPFLFVIGSPLNFGRHAAPTREEVRDAHETFVEEVKRLFNTYKKFYGWNDKQLEIL